MIKKIYSILDGLFRPILLLIPILMISCSGSEEFNNNNCTERNDIYTLERNDDIISFQLDSLTSPNIDYLKMVKLNDTLYFTLLNTFTNTIYCYEYKSKELFKTIHLTSPKKISGYEIINWNSILTYQYWTYNLILQDSTGKIRKNVIVPRKDDSYYSVPTTHSQIIYKNKSIYLAGGMLSSRMPNGKSPVVAQVDSDFLKISYLYHFPVVYTKMYFGAEQYRTGITYAYNSVEDIFIFNFPASHELFVTKDFLSEKVYCAGSRFINVIPKYPYKNRDDAFKYCAENGFYYCILFDQYNECYYRISLLPTIWNANEPYIRDLTIIILDKEFNIVGEKRLKSTEYDLGGIKSICVSPDGLLFRKENEPSDESSIKFITFKLVKL